ncbi:MAG TPA: hypothetical protein VGE01_05675 [Fimbriimonas sp.]
MWLKRATVGLVVVGTFLLLAWPLFFGTKPVTRSEALVYSRNSAIYIGVLLLILISAGVCALVVLRRAREEYRELARENMRLLIEATREDAKGKDA